MSKRRQFVSVALATGCLALSALMLNAQSGAPPELPAGEMQAKARTACTECHDAHIILQQRLNRATWSKEVDKMIKWGAVVDPKDRDALVDYLSANFSADKDPEPAAMVK
jgi:hypothetical protein